MRSDDLADRYDQMRRQLISMPEGIGEYWSTVGPHPAPGSPIEQQKAIFAPSTSIATAFSRTSLLLLAAAHHTRDLGELLAEPVSPFTTYLVARGVLELCSQAYWLLDPDIDPTERVRRSLLLRNRDLNDQLAFYRTAPGGAGRLSAEHDTVIQQIEARIADSASQAQAAGFEVASDKRGRVVGFDTPMPSATELIQITLGDGSLYRLFSAASHGRVWALLSLGLRVDSGTQMATEYVPLRVAIGLVTNAFKWFSKCAWQYTLAHGWDTRPVARLLDVAADRAFLTEEARFWRGAG